MKFCRRPLIVAVYTALLFPLYSQAQLYNYSYTDTRGTKVNAEPTREYLNPGSAITLNLIQWPTGSLPLMVVSTTASP